MSADSNMRSSRVFRFKRFSLINERSAQKIGTDGVLTGALAGTDCKPKEIWDVGAGTGLIALMMAQRFDNVHITAIEIDDIAAEECSRNIALSPWPDRIEVVKGDICSLWQELPAPDLIVSNPPFFSLSGATAPDSRRARARQDGSLSPLSLIQLAAEALMSDGRLVFITQASREEEILLSAELSRMDIINVTEIASKSDRDPMRLLITMKHRYDNDSCAKTVRTRLDIRSDSAGNPFTDEYRRVTGDFYLDF